MATRKKKTQRKAPARKPAPKPRQPEELVHQYKKDLELKREKTEKRRLLREVLSQEKRLKVIHRLAEMNAPPIVSAKKPHLGGKREAAAVVLCSDWHVEEPVYPEQVNGMNRYNLDIARQRIDRLLQGILWLLRMHRESFKIKELVLWLGGDLMSGYIHDELVESNLLSPVETILWLQKELVTFINVLLKHGGLERLYIPCSYGNHGRTTAKRRISTGAENSYEWMMYQNLAERYENNPKVIVRAPKSPLVYLQVYDYVLRFAHGDQLGFQGGVGGLTIPLNKKIANWDHGQKADITNIGHWHTYTSLENAVVNGSLIGYNAYAVNGGFKYEDPVQAFYLVDSKRGKTASYPIWVTKKGPR